MLQENQLIPYETSSLPKGPWLVFAPHPDDETFGMGGSLLLAARQRIDTHLVILTDGGHGGDRTDEGLANRREQEARRAAHHLGIGELHLWRQRDRELRATPALIQRVANLVKELDPASVFFPSPMELHPDHRATALLVWEGLRSAGFSGTLCGYEISVQGQVNRLIDITPVLAEKRAVMDLYPSQLSENDYAGVVLALNKARTYTLPKQVTHAEGFYLYPDCNKDLARQTRAALLPYWQQEPARAKPLVSVIIRTMNRPHMLGKALQSVAEQTYPHMEAVVVNDGGKDVDTVVASFQDVIPKIQSLRLEPHRGRAIAANTGLDRARGDYLIFLDDDDWFLPDHVSDLMDALERNEPMGVAYAGVECLTERAPGHWEQTYIFNQPFDPVRLLIANYIPMHAALFRRDLVEAGCRVDEDLDTYEDWDFWLQLSQKTHFCHVDKVSAVYRIGAAGGFGVSKDERRIRIGQEKFFRKWRTLWSTDQIVDIAEYAKHKQMYVELRKRLESQGEKLSEIIKARDELAAKQSALTAELQELHRGRQQLAAAWEHQKTELKHQQSQLEQAEARQAQSQRQIDAQAEQLADARSQREDTHNRLSNAQRRLALLQNQLASTQRELRTRTDELAGAEHRIRQLSGTVQDLENSTIWKATSPLRSALIGFRRARQAALTGIGRLRRSGNRTDQAQDGPRTPASATGPAMTRVWGELSFAASAHPQISVIVPVHRALHHTLNCLKAIAADQTKIPFELIAVEDHADAETTAALAAIKNLRRCNSTGTNAQSFPQACEVGARHARGKYLVFLSDATIVPRAWLDTLLQTFQEWPDAGLIGVKILYPYGILKQAGGILWNDGSTTSFGRGDDPGKPPYNYARAVDYCSGACLAVPRELFLELGYRDEALQTPAIWDVDLALRVKAAGKQVIYQPAIGVVQFNATPSGAPAPEAPEAVRTLDHGVLAQRWQTLLATHGAHGYMPDLEKDREVRARALLIDAIMITPDQDSGSLRMARLLQILRTLGTKVTFVASNLEFHPPYGAQLQEQGIEVLHAPFTQSIEAYLQANGPYLDVVILSRVAIAARFADMVHRYAPSALVIFDTVDLHFLREQRMAEVNGDIQLAETAAATRDQELALMQKVDVTLVVSPVEREIIAEHNPDLKVEVLSNIHDTHVSGIDFQERHDVLFIGGFNHPPNTDAVLYYVREILPRVERELGDIKTFIVGSKPPREIIDLASDTIIVTGHVPDVTPYFAHCRLSIAPLRYGAGVKGKINTSMCYGVPVVATPLAVEGMYLSDGENVLVGDDAESFARCVVTLYRDAELWHRLAKNGLLNIEKHFSTTAAKKVLEKIFRDRGVLP